MPNEIEWRLKIDPAGARRLQIAAWLKPFVAAPIERHRLVSTYYDTKSRALRDAGLFSAGARTLVLPRLAAVVPARNERGNIATCIDALHHQFYPNDRLRLIVVNDNSTDDTATSVRRIADEDDRVMLVEAGPLPPGWAGKPHACWRGARGDTAAEWLCFVDADTRAAPGLLRTAVVAAQRRGLALLSLSPLQELSNFHDRLLLPLGFLIIAATQDVTRLTEISPEGPSSTANSCWSTQRPIPRLAATLRYAPPSARTARSPAASSTAGAGWRCRAARR